MPAAYAHLTFGRRVFDSLPGGEVKNAVAPYRALFEIGLQGPDVLFFHRPLRGSPVSRLGNALHDKTGRSFLSRDLCRAARGGARAYLLGLICHFALDSECHTLVEYFMGVTGREHSTLETDLERHLMVRDGLNPRAHVAASCLVDSRSNAEVIAPFYGLDGETLKAALSSMKRVGKLLRPGNRVKHAFLTFVTGRMGPKSVPRQLVMDWMSDPVYETFNRVLTRKIGEAVPVAVELMEDFLRWQTGERPLTPRFDRTFSYDEEELTQLKEGHACV